MLRIIKKLKNLFVPPTIYWIKFYEDSIMPSRAHNDDLGYDLHTYETIDIPPYSVLKIPTGVGCVFPDGYGGMIEDRSGIATKLGLTKVAGVIDPSYRGEILVALYNTNDKIVSFKKGDRIAQLILVQQHEAKSAWATIKQLYSFTTRNVKGFGSTGV